MSVEIRDAVPEDVAEVQRIERASFGDPWSRAMFMEYVGPSEQHAFIVAVAHGSVTGYAMTRVVSGESELLNIAVSPSHRGNGTGARLLDAAMERCRVAGATEMWLEVRASNGAARALYASRGFSEMGVRKRYYDSPREDAILLRAELAVGSKMVRRAAPSLAGEEHELILSRASHIPRQEIT